MTSCAIHLGMLAFEGESGSAMVKKWCFPIVEAMTALAIGKAVLFKLITMHIFMTGIAGLGNPNKFTIRSCLIAGMTTHTGGSLMHSLKRKGSLLVIKAQ